MRRPHPKPITQFVCILAVVSLAACGPKDDEENNTNNVNNVNNTNNVDPDMGGDSGMPDTGMDMQGPEVVACQVITVTPRTIAATDGADVTVEYTCSGATEGTMAAIEYVIALPDGTTQEGTADMPLTFETEREGELGTGTVTLGIRSSTFVAGSVGVTFSDFENQTGSVAWGESHTALIRVRQRPDELVAEWDELIDEALEKIRENPLSSAQWVQGLEDPAKPSVLSAWREGTQLVVERRIGDGAGGFLPQATESVELGADATATAGYEGFHLARRKGATDDTQLALYWYALDQTTKSFRVMYVPVDSGVLGAASHFDTAGQGFPLILEVLDVEIVDDGNVMPNDPPELAIVYRGEQDSNGVFSTLTTHKEGQSFKSTVYPTFGDDITTDMVETGRVEVGFMRSNQGSTNPAELVDVNSLMAWTLGTTGAAGEHELRRVALFGGEAGLTRTTAVIPNVDAGEAHFAVDVVDADGDGNNDLVLSSSLTNGEPKLVFLKVDDGGNFGPDIREANAGNTSVILTDHDAERAKIRWGKRQGRVYGHADSPYLQELAGDLQHTSATYFVGAMGSMPVNGNRIAVEIAWTFEVPGSSDLAFVAPISVGTTEELADFMPDRALALGQTSTGGLTMSVRSTEDAVLIASHSNGKRLLMTAGLYPKPPFVPVPPVVAGDNISIPPHYAARGVSLFEDTASSTTFVLVRTDAPGDSDGVFDAWQIGMDEATGPIQITFPKTGTFELMGASDDTMRFSTVEDESHREFTVDPTSVADAIKTKSNIAVTEAQIRTFGGVGSDPPAALRKRSRRRTGRVRPERAYKRTNRWAVDQGFNSASPVLEVLRVDDGDACPYQVVVTDTDSSAPVSVGESAMAGCWDLPAVVAIGDVCGVGGEQFVTAAATDTAGENWIWEFLLVTSTGTKMMGTELGFVTLPKETVPETTVTDINGDGLEDIAVFVPEYTEPDGKKGGSTAWLLSDGLGGALNNQPMILPKISEVVSHFPGAGRGLPGGQFGCGNGLLCAFGKGTKSSCSAASAKPQLL